MNPDPLKDGIDHINVWSKGRTALGQMLSNFAHVGFEHPEYGFFASMEGYWYWCGSGRSHDELRRLYGMSAKSVGVKLDNVPMDEDEFRGMILEGLRCKVTQNSDLQQALKTSVLPLEHYFVYGHTAVVNRRDKHGWQLDFLTALRQELQGGPQPLAGVLDMVEMANGSWKAPIDLQVGDKLKNPHDPALYPPMNIKYEHFLAGAGLMPTDDVGGVHQNFDGSVTRWGGSDGV